MSSEHAQIDVADQHAALRDLAGPDRFAAVARILAAPEQYAPPVLMAMASVLFVDGRRETGAFWFYAGQLRARFDANRCTDVSASAACGALTETYGPPINRWAFAQPGLVLDLVERVAAWDAATPSVYDHRWIALHGMSAFLGSESPLSVPGERWTALAERTRREYVEGARQLFDDDGRLRSELFDRS